MKKPLPKFLARFLSLFWNLRPEGHVVSHEEVKRLAGLLQAVKMYRQEETTTTPDPVLKKVLRDRIDETLRGDGQYVRLIG